MEEKCIYSVGSTQACRFAREGLSRAGVFISDHPRPEVTHVLLDAPSFLTSGELRGGGHIEDVLERLPEDVTVIGGRLNHPALEGYRTLDLLRREEYLAGNAAITADCALRLAAPLLTATFQESPALILGWGRIGKCLGQMLKGLGVSVTVAARKESDRGMLRALGYKAVGFDQVPAVLPGIRLLFNTVPEKVLEYTVPRGCIQIDLASTPGLYGDNVIFARGLPGIHAPESSGALIADTLLKEWRKETL